MPQFNERLASEVQRVLREHGLSDRKLSLRDAEARTRINYTTIREMARGHVPRPETLAKFAIGFGEDKTYWLSLGGYQDDNLPEFAPLPEEAKERFLVERYRRLSPEKKRLAEQLLEGLAV